MNQAIYTKTAYFRDIDLRLRPRHAKSGQASDEAYPLSFL